MASVVRRIFKGLTETNRGDQGLTLKGQAGAVSVDVLAADLIRLRASRSKRALSTGDSWAVVQSAWRGIKVSVKKTTQRFELKTQTTGFVIHRKTGAWTLNDASGRSLIECPAEAWGFSGDAPFCSLCLTDEEQIFGLGETSGTFDKRGLIREFWNIDVLGHAPAIHPSLRHLYVSIPFFVSIRDGRVSGLFWDNPARQTWDLGQTVSDRLQMQATQGEIDVYLFSSRTVAGLLERFTKLTGRMPLPPRWALGYHQCRYSYETREAFESVARKMRRRKIPCDALYLDIHHMDEYRVFTFGKSFPDPAKMLKKTKRAGYHTVAIVDPGVKDDPRFGVLKRGRALDGFVKAPDGKSDFLGEVWPGRSRFPDFFRVDTRAWWAKEQGVLHEIGVDGIWNDMNEPANFALPTKTLELECQHRTEHGVRSHEAVHNVYGMQMARASREGSLAFDPTKRPFVITRAGYAGVQRHAMVWTGDNSSTWEHLADSIQMLCNLSLSGVPFCGGDAGGFMDNTTGELLARWMQCASLTPFFRNHSNIGTVPQEPWAFGSSVEGICRQAIELRYRLMPYLYGLFHEANRLGTPIMRPLLFHYQNDREAVSRSDEFLLGSDLLVAPVLRQGARTREVYLPQGTWFDFWTGERLRGPIHLVASAPLNRLPLYVRGGAIIPMTSVHQHAGEYSVEDIVVHLWVEGRGECRWCEDDGVHIPLSEADCFRRRLRLRSHGRAGRLVLDAVGGERESELHRWLFSLHGLTAKPSAELDGEALRVRWDTGSKAARFQLPNTPDRLTLDLKLP